MSDLETCVACGTVYGGRATCNACGTSSRTATLDGLVARAMLDAAEARAAQVEEAARGNTQLAAHLGRVVDSYLDAASDLRGLGPL